MNPEESIVEDTSIPGTPVIKTTPELKQIKWDERLELVLIEKTLEHKGYMKTHGETLDVKWDRITRDIHQIREFSPYLNIITNRSLRAKFNHMKKMVKAKYPLAEGEGSNLSSEKPSKAIEIMMCMLKEEKDHEEVEVVKQNSHSIQRASLKRERNLISSHSATSSIDDSSSCSVDQQSPIELPEECNDPIVLKKSHIAPIELFEDFDDPLVLKKGHISFPRRQSVSELKYQVFAHHLLLHSTNTSGRRKKKTDQKE